MTNDPREILARSPMGRFQIMAVATCVLLNALDGFDVLSISFASPGIAAEWGIDSAALGIVLSMELIGMAVGSVLVGAFADHFGRRPAILGCDVVMAAGMALAATAGGVETLSAFRLLTGVGIGGMLAVTNAMAAEFANLKRRSLAVTIMATGYPIGAIVGGAVASELLVNHTWRAVFTFGAVATGCALVLAWGLLPESIEYLARKRPPNALARINATLGRMGHRPILSLPEAPAPVRRIATATLFSPGLARTTILLTVAYFTHIMTFYFILKWIPKIVVDMGFPPPMAGNVLVWANVGGASGSILLGLLSQRFDVRRLVLVALVIAAAMVTLFGQGQADLQQLSIVAAIAGFFTNSAVVGLYALFVHSFPTEVRAGGTGFVIGIGRGGAALGPIVAGFLFAAGQSLGIVAFVMGCGSLIAAAAIYMLRERSQTSDGATVG